MDTLKPFPKEQQKIVTVTIDENGDVLFLATDANDIFLNDGDVLTKRASHVEPASLYERWFFHFLRLFGDKMRVAEWTRGWKCLWRVNTRPVGGPILRWGHIYPNVDFVDPTVRSLVYCWVDRQDAIDAEIKFLNVWFLERGIQ